MATELPPVRRVITGMESGKSVFLEDGPAPVRQNSSRPGQCSSVIWATGRLPVCVGDPDQSAQVRGIMPPAGGSLLRMVDYPPEPKDPAERDRVLAEIRKRVREAGIEPEPGQRRRPDSPHPGMHETDSIDYAIVISGEIYAIMEKGEKLLRAGDVLIQRGTLHSWSNRSDAYCRVAFMLVEARR